LIEGVHDPEEELRVSVSLVSCQSKPPHGVGIVLRDTSTVGAHDPEDALRGGITGFRLSVTLLKLFLTRVRLWFSHDAVTMDSTLPLAGGAMRLARVRGVPFAGEALSLGDLLGGHLGGEAVVVSPPARVRGVPLASEAFSFSNLGGVHLACNYVATLGRRTSQHTDSS